MAQPTRGDVHVNKPLTNISIAFMQAATNFVADTVFPNIPVPNVSDRYYTYDRGYFNRDEMQERAPGTESAGSGYAVDNTPTYYCKVYAFHHDVPDQVRSNADSPVQPDRDATQLVSQKALIKREKLWVARYFQPALWTFDVDGVAAAPTPGTQVLQWNDANSTPIEDIAAAMDAVLEETGFLPNKLILGRQVWTALKNHPDIIDRVKYGQTPGGTAKISLQALADLFEVQQIVVMNAIENTSKEGAAANHAFIGGKKALLVYAAPSPGLQVPTAGYTFSWSGFLGAGAMGGRIKKFRMEELESDRVEIQMAFDQKLVSADLGYFFDTIVA
jgi:hypothetical protein